MKLNETQIRKILHNVLYQNFDINGHLPLCRFTQSQLDVYEADYPDLCLRAKASAGVTLDFITDSEYIAIRLDMYRGVDVWSDFDLYVDGIFTDHKHFDNLWPTIISFSLPAGTHRITLFFPWSVEIVLKEIHLSDNAIIKEITKRAKGIVFGDSISQGYYSRFTSMTYTNQLAMDLNLELLNQAVGGYYFGCDSLEEALTNYKPDFIIIAYGTNDYSRYETEAEFKNFASLYIKKLTSLFPNTPMLGILPLYRNDETVQGNEKCRKYTLENARQILTQIYGEYDNIFILEETGIPHIREAFIEDFLHPNDLGFTFIAKHVVRHIDKLLCTKLSL